MSRPTPRKIRRSIVAEPGTDLDLIKRVFDDIRATTSPFYGIDERTPEEPNARTKHAYSNRQIMEGINDRRPCKPPTDSLMMGVLAGKVRDLLGTADGFKEKDEAFFDIDVDCKKRPNPAQANAFLDLVEKNVGCLKGLFRSGGSSNKGTHGSGVLVKGVHIRSAESLNQIYRNLEAYLVRLLKGCQQSGLFRDITGVEVNGHAPEFDWDDEPGTGVRIVTRMKAGILGRIPVAEAVDRPREWLARPRVFCLKLTMTLARLRDDDLELPRLEVKAKAAKTVTTKQNVVPVTIPMPSLPRPNPPCRSRSGHPLTPEQLDQHLKAMEEFARRIAPNGVPMASPDIACTIDDLAKHLLLMTHIMNDHQDRSMPTARFEALHQSLHQSEDREVRARWDKAYSPKRHAACRNYLSKLGMIEWPEGGNHFYTGEREKGKFLKGKCMRYNLTNEVVGRIREILSENAGKVQRENLTEGGLHNPDPDTSRGAENQHISRGGNLTEGGPTLLPGYRFLEPLSPPIESLLGPDHSRTAYREPVNCGRLSVRLGYFRSAAA